MSASLDSCALDTVSVLVAGAFVSNVAGGTFTLGVGRRVRFELLATAGTAEPDLTALMVHRMRRIGTYLHAAHRVSLFDPDLCRILAAPMVGGAATIGRPLAFS